MLWFWVATALLGGALSALVLLRAAQAAKPGGVLDPEGEIYRRQLSEIDGLARRELLAPEDVGAIRAEAARRLLASTRRGGRGAHPVPPNAKWVIAAAVAAPVTALALYLALGAPGIGDQPHGDRVADWRRADPSALGPAEMAAVLREVTREHPRDVQAMLYFARAQALSGQAPAALRTLRRAAELEPRRAEVWSLSGELQAGGGEGPLPPSARSAFERALTLDRREATARYFLGRDLLARGERSRGLRLWSELLSDLPRDDPRREALRQEIARAEDRGTASGSRRLGADMAETRMIDDMVARLAGRLKVQPDDPAGWARLIRAYGVLNRPAERGRSLLAARRLFRNRPEALRQIDAAAADSSTP